MIPSGGITLELMRNKAGQNLGISPAPESRQLSLLWGGVRGSDDHISVLAAYRAVGERWGLRGWEGLALCLPSPFSWHSEPLQHGGLHHSHRLYHSKLWEWWPEKGMLWGLSLPAASWQMGRGSSS